MSQSDAASMVKLLKSPDLAEAKKGIRLLRKYVGDTGEKVSLKDFDVSDYRTSEADRETSTFGILWKNHGETLSTEELLDVVFSLFNRAGESEKFVAPIPFLDRLTEEGSSETEAKLLEIYANASYYYDDGHLYEEGTTRDIFTEFIFPKFQTESLAAVVQWAAEKNYLSDLGHLFPIACERKDLSANNAAWIIKYFKKEFSDVLSGNGKIYDHDREEGGLFKLLEDSREASKANKKLHTALKKLAQEIETTGGKKREFLDALASPDPGESEKALMEIGKSYSPLYLISEIGACQDMLLRHYAALPLECLGRVLKECIQYLTETKGRGVGRDWRERFYVGDQLFRVIFKKDEDYGRGLAVRLAKRFSEEPFLIHSYVTSAAGARRGPKGQKPEEEEIFCSYRPELEEAAVSLLPENEQNFLKSARTILETWRGSESKIMYCGYTDNGKSKPMTLGAWFQRVDVMFDRVHRGESAGCEPDLPGGEIITDIPRKKEAYARHARHLSRLDIPRELNASKNLTVFIQKGEKCAYLDSFSLEYRY